MPAPGARGGVGAAPAAPTGDWMQGSTTVTATPTAGADAPGWYHGDGNTLRYWDGHAWTGWNAEWNGSKWVQTQSPA